jgi:hypothetical protein
VVGASAPLRALAIWRKNKKKAERRNLDFLIRQPYEATPQDGIACIGNSSYIGMALMAVTSPHDVSTLQCWRSAFLQASLQTGCRGIRSDSRTVLV